MFKEGNIYGFWQWKKIINVLFSWKYQLITNEKQNLDKTKENKEKNNRSNKQTKWEKKVNKLDGFEKH